MLVCRVLCCGLGGLGVWGFRVWVSSLQFGLGFRAWLFSSVDMRIQVGFFLKTVHGVSKAPKLCGTGCSWKA